VRTFAGEQESERASSEVKEIVELWRAINRTLHLGARHVFREVNLPPGAMFVLGQVAREPGLTIGEIARRSGVAKSHVSNTVNTLVREQYVVKQPDDEDARLVRVRLAPAAESLMAQLEQRSQEVWAGSLRDLEEGERARVLEGMRILRGALESASEKEEAMNDENPRGGPC